jgi:hypothetical protein
MHSQFQGQIDPFKLTHPQGFQWTHCKSKDEDSEKKRNWGTFPSSYHFGGWGVRWSSGVGIRKIDKQLNYSHGPAQTKQQVG